MSLQIPTLKSREETKHELVGLIIIRRKKWKHLLWRLVKKKRRQEKKAEVDEVVESEVKCGKKMWKKIIKAWIFMDVDVVWRREKMVEKGKVSLSKKNSWALMNMIL